MKKSKHNASVKLRIWPFFLCFFLFSCRTITHSKTEVEMPPLIVTFSFDDGPTAHDNTTARLLDVLKKYHVQAMFALLGENAKQYPELVRRIYDEGHFIVNHGYADIWARKMEDNEFKENLVKGETAISSALGREWYPRLYRPHGGFYNSRQKRIWQEAGYTMIPGNIRVYDTRSKKNDLDKTVRNVIRKVEKQGGGIILLHDSCGSASRMEEALEKNPEGSWNRSWIPEAVEEIIIALLDKGYTFGSPLYSLN